MVDMLGSSWKQLLAPNFAVTKVDWQIVSRHVEYIDQSWGYVAGERENEGVDCY